MNEEDVIVTHRYTILYDETTDESEVNLVDSFDDEEPTTTMDEITKKFKFLNDDIAIGKVKKGEKALIEFPFIGDTSIIEKVKPGCGCTAEVKIDEEKRVISAIYDSSNDAKGGFSKGVRVYFKDGLNLEITNQMGIKQINPKKASVSLKFSGQII